MRITAVAVATCALAAVAWAGGDQHIQYQNALLHRALDPADQAFCTQQAAGDATAFDRCHVTRLFLFDISRNADQGFPPMTDIRYVQTPLEKTRLLDKLTQYGG